MPYRRLPNTDKARLSALQNAVQRASEADYNEQVLDYKTLQEAHRFLMQFETLVLQYHDNYQSKVSANKQYSRVVKTARMYISHFIQVLNLSVIRGEIKKEQKALYGLDTHNNVVPDLTSEEDLLYWGEKIIAGENERTSKGGFPIYNPAINKVKVYYDIFKEQQTSHSFHKKNTTRAYENVEQLRSQADALILDIWNKVEEHFKDSLPYKRLTQCKQYGVIYYYRSGEKRLTPETDKRIEEDLASQTSIQWT